ncbi:hypothetical protein CFOL_v3_14266 [Cephalotus follicularis]|uniref:Uncharacterized protein n=1 Tax=Cephalotus follicularis TaxID=3775 RepID=A0A1Q3BS53_CEPFO|nr:hypothetical protein CFOL_v3_14266 [Cephalotus follicularis]
MAGNNLFALLGGEEEDSVLNSSLEQVKAKAKTVKEKEKEKEKNKNENEKEEPMKEKKPFDPTKLRAKPLVLPYAVRRSFVVLRKEKKSEEAQGNISGEGSNNYRKNNFGDYQWNYKGGKRNGRNNGNQLKNGTDAPGYIDKDGFQVPSRRLFKKLGNFNRLKDGGVDDPSVEQATNGDDKSNVSDNADKEHAVANGDDESNASEKHDMEQAVNGDKQIDSAEKNEDAVVEDNNSEGTEGKASDKPKSKSKKKKKKNAEENFEKTVEEPKKDYVKRMTLVDYEKEQFKRRRSLESLKKTLERKVTIDEDFKMMQIIDKKEVDNLTVKQRSNNKLRKKDNLGNEKKVSKPITYKITEFLKPAEVERPNGGRGRNGERTNGRGRNGKSSNGGRRRDGERPHYAAGRGQSVEKTNGSRGGEHDGKGAFNAAEGGQNGKRPNGGKYSERPYHADGERDSDSREHGPPRFPSPPPPPPPPRLDDFSQFPSCMGGRYLKFTGD